MTLKTASQHSGHAQQAPRAKHGITLVCVSLLACIFSHSPQASAQVADMEMQRLVTLSERHITDAAPVDAAWAHEGGRASFYDAPVMAGGTQYGNYLYWGGNGSSFDPNDWTSGVNWSNLPSNSRSRMGPAILRVSPTPAKYQKSVITKEIFGVLMSTAMLGTQVIERTDGSLIAGLIQDGRTLSEPWSRDNMYPAPAREFRADQYGSTLLKTGALVRTDGDGANARLILSTLNQVHFPYGRFAQASDGTLYGMDEGPDGHGRIYRLSPSDKFSTVHTFPAPAAGTGQWLNDVMLGSDGWLYGILAYGRGKPGAPATRTTADTPTGLVFKLHPDQPGSYTVLRTFTLKEGEFNVDNPYHSNGLSVSLKPTGMNTLTEGPDGRIYGTSSISSCSVFSDFQTWVLRPETSTNELVTSQRVTPSLLCGSTEGSRSLTSAGTGFPRWEFLGNGNTYDVDFQRNGTLFRLDRDGNNFQVLHRFEGGSHGATPRGSFVFLGNTLVGTTLSGGEPHYSYSNYPDPVPAGWVRNNMPAHRSEDDFAHKTSDGLLYALDIAAWENGADNAFQILHEFSERTTGRTPTGVTLGQDGALYGMTRYGGADRWFSNQQGRSIEYAYSTSGTIWRYGPDQGASINLNVFPAALKRGETARLTWTAAGVVEGSCTATSKSGDWTGPQAAEGSIDLTKTDSGIYTYSLSCVSATTGQAVGSDPATLRVDSPASETDGNSIKYTGGGGALPLWPALGLLLLAAGRRARRPY